MVIQTSISAPCRRDQVVDILTGAVLRLLATRAMNPSPMVVEDLMAVPDDGDCESLVGQKPAK